MPKKTKSAGDKKLLATPIGFIVGVLGLSMYAWQRKAVAPLERAGYGKPIVQVSTLAPNEGGKSSRIVAGAGTYWLSIHKKGKVGITTKDQKQLNEQIIPAIEDQIHKLPGFKSVRSPYYRVTTPTGGVLIAFTTDDASRVEGLHGSPDAPLLWEIDEAKSVEEKIFEGIDRCGYQALIYSSSGGLMQGTFYKSQTDNSSAFHCVRAGLKDCPHISQEKINRIISKYGEDHPFTRSSIYGEFMEQDELDQFVFPLSALDACIKNPPKHKPGLKLAFCDFAEGVAEHVLVLRDGNKAWVEKAWHDANKHAAASRFVYEFRKAGLTEDQIWGDAADAEMLKLIADLGWTINSQNFGHKAGDDEKYQSWSAEAWHETALMALQQEIIIPDNDPLLVEQLMSRKKTIVGRGKMGVEEKYVMRKRNIPSPDRGDAFCGAFNVRDFATTYKQPFKMPLEGVLGQIEATEHREVLEELGAFAG